MDDQIEHYISECSTHFQGYIRREIAKLFAGKTQEKEEPIGGLVTSSVDSLTHADEADAEAELSNERSSETYKKKLLRLQQRFGYKIVSGQLHGNTQSILVGRGFITGHLCISWALYPNSTNRIVVDECSQTPCSTTITDEYPIKLPITINGMFSGSCKLGRGNDVLIIRVYLLGI